MQIFKNLFSKPLSIKLKVTSPNGFHLRPTARFTTLAKSFECDIKAKFKHKTVDAKKVNSLLSLSLEKNDTFSLIARGKEAQKALMRLQALFETLMQEDRETEQIKKEHSCYEGEILEGEIIAKGVAISPASVYKTERIQHESTLNFQDAVDKSIKALEERYETQKKSNNAEIYLAQKALLSTLAEKCNSLEALEHMIAEESATLKKTKHSAKISDYQDILQQVKTALGLEIKMHFDQGDFILLADDLLPSEIALLSKTRIQGVILKETAINSHTAILLRASGIPSLIADTSQIPLSSKIILDTYAGVAVLHPSSNDIHKATLLQKQHKKAKEDAASRRFEPASTIRGKTVKVYANVGDLLSAKIAKEEGAEGIGLLRSEFLFTSTKPSLESQIKAYREIFDTFEEVTVRTLDVGGDKTLPYINIPLEKNPFLGIRGVRLLKTHPKILAEQLHAIFLAAQGKKVKVMFPMISTVEEFRQAKSFAKEVAQKHNIEIGQIDFGIMIEVPSTLFLIPAFNEAVDFYSIGSNDLAQYLFAIERTHPLLKIDALSPVIFFALESVVKQATKPVSICGELAADSDAIERLVNLGFHTLSVNPKSVAQTKEIIRHV